MRFIHLSDLHLGKRVKDFSMIEDQRYILDRILEIVAAQQADAVLIAGDIYDKPSPSAEAVELFDSFLVRLTRLGQRVFVISGNHDSAERIAFGAKLMDKGGVYLSPVYDGAVEPIRLEDEFGFVNVYMLPFIKPIHVRNCFEDEEINSFNDAVECAVKHMGIDSSQRNLLITHQFVSGAESCESEIAVGGTEAVDRRVFEAFDYVALGHIHGPQNIGSERVRYCGTPLKYSFSEAEHKKSLTVVELLEKGNVRVDTVPLTPMRDMLKIRGSYEEIMSRSFYERGDFKDAYLQITLTDEEEIPGALSCLRVIYPNIMRLDYDNIRSREFRIVEGLDGEKEKTPLEIFAELYEIQNNRAMTEQQFDYISALIGALEKEAE